MFGYGKWYVTGDIKLDREVSYTLSSAGSGLHALQQRKNNRLNHAASHECSHPVVGARRGALWINEHLLQVAYDCICCHNYANVSHSHTVYEWHASGGHDTQGVYVPFAMSTVWILNTRISTRTPRAILPRHDLHSNLPRKKAKGFHVINGVLSGTTVDSAATNIGPREGVGYERQRYAFAPHRDRCSLSLINIPHR